MSTQGRAGSAPEIEAVKVVALYEAGTGKIAHMHVVTTLKGGVSVSDDEAIAAAQEHAGRLGHPVAQLKTQVSSRLEHAAGPHRIDPQTGQFVPIPLPNLQRRERDVLERKRYPS